MKHELNKHTIYVESFDVSNKVINILEYNKTNNIDNDSTDIQPIIHNSTITSIDKELENERFATLIKLARGLDDTQLNKVINLLNYKLNVE